MLDELTERLAKIESVAAERSREAFKAWLAGFNKTRRQAR